MAMLNNQRVYIYTYFFMGLSENGLSPQCCWFYQKHDESQVDLGIPVFFQTNPHIVMMGM